MVGSPAARGWRISIQYVPFEKIVDEAIRLLGGTVVSNDPDIELFVRVRDTNDRQEKIFA